MGACLLVSGVIHDEVLRLLCRFGDIFKTKLMGALCIIATNPDFIKWVLAHDGKEIITGYPKSFKNVIGGDSTLNSVGAPWKSARKFLVNSLRTERLRTRVSVVEDLILECLDSWQNKDPVNVREETKSVRFCCCCCCCVVHS